MGHVREFLVEGIIGQGAFGKIIATSLRKEDNNCIPYALKCIHPIVKTQRLANELRHLRDLGGKHNVVKMHAAFLNGGSLFIVMDLFEHDRFIDIVANLELEEIVIYMKNLLEALEHVHSFNVMHRDIKPANFLFNRKNKKFLLVDFGLAQVVRVRKGSLFGCGRPTTSVGGLSTHSILSAPTTPTSTQTRRTIAYSQTPDAQDRRLDIRNRINNDYLIKTTPVVNINSITHKIIHQSPARHYINLAPTNSPSTPNVATKRLVSDLNNTNCIMLKKLRVSNKDDEIKEPVKLTVGAYESPVTNNDSGSKRINHNQYNHKFSTPIAPSRQNYGTRCDCRGKPRTCKTCPAKADSNAPKSGTPGYKAPEVLLRSMNQTTAIDIWSAGVIFACLLSGHAPFLRDADDMASLAEIVSLLGSQKLIQAAKAIGSHLNVQLQPREPVDLMQFCREIRLTHIDKRQIDIPDEAFDLLYRMLDPNPATRITARDALKHSWFEDSQIVLRELDLNTSSAIQI